MAIIYNATQKYYIMHFSVDFMCQSTHKEIIQRRMLLFEKPLIDKSLHLQFLIANVCILKY